MFISFCFVVLTEGKLALVIDFCLGTNVFVLIHESNSSRQNLLGILGCNLMETKSPEHLHLVLNLMFAFLVTFLKLATANHHIFLLAQNAWESLATWVKCELLKQFMGEGCVKAEDST